MPRFARLFEAAADTLNAYSAVADANLDALLGQDRRGFRQLRMGGRRASARPRPDPQRAANRLATRPVTIEPLDIRVYDSLGTVVYTIAEAHQQADLTAEPDMVSRRT